MHVLNKTSEIKSKALIMLCGIPLCALHVIVTQFAINPKFSVFKAFGSKNLNWIIIQSVFIIAMSVSILNLKKWVYRAYPFFSAAVIGYGATVFMRSMNYSVAFWSLFLSLCSVLYFLSLEKLYNRSFLNSGRKWFEGRPKYIPNLNVEVSLDNQFKAFNCSRMDHEGCYLYFAENAEKIEKNTIFDSVRFSFKEKQLTVKAEAVSVERSCDGVGLKFLGLNTDESKDLFEFVDRIRSYGYVD